MGSSLALRPGTEACVIGARSLQFLKELGERVRRQTGAPKSTSYLLQRLSLQLPSKEETQLQSWGVSGVASV